MADDSRLRERSAREVLDDHLRLSDERRFDDDIARNCAPDCVVLTGRGVYRGHDGLRTLARALAEEVPSGVWQYPTRLAEGRMAFIEWTVESDEAIVNDGADSFVIENGLIVYQTIHYTVLDRSGRVIVRADGTRPG
ncbi:SnoaL-like domain-containing protein [Micromonospora pattaloongensis]|uniref:SnoaL-like domain-containing protein n=1 Tax=Micromonospora pattaloongensis TaxID=405436 RepID=A0A1H3QSJ2_9ACTN|nr:nuclear transport factor 2 family protein [Micromonospora pattaloongensis]SDZ16397.1 SnoaL-like domain-containing protein [Micromonospora pattaloongensis]